MYVIEYRRNAENTGDDWTMLHEMTAREMKDAQDKARPNHEWTRIDAARAHDWVRRGNLHSTTLWICDNRIRKAG